MPVLAITRQRARALGLKVSGPVALPLAPGLSAEQILSIAAEAQVEHQHVEFEPLRSASIAAIELTKLAQALPAVLAAPVPAAAPRSAADPIVTIEAKSVAEFRRGLASSLRITAETSLPLQAGVSGRFVLFADALGRVHTAVIVGEPDFTKPVPVRLHSACLTGDVFGSRRCDCGDQLRLSLTRLRDAGGGVILYLAQEGRGLGLANKIRAYRLQDAGLDTVDANTALGFEYDEREYSIAARMLKALGCARVLLLSNNPAKIDGLAENGIDIEGQIPLLAPITSDNRRYLTAKATRAGHRIDQLIEDLTEH